MSKHWRETAAARLADAPRVVVALIASAVLGCNSPGSIEMDIPPGAVALQVSPFAETIANLIYSTGGQSRQRTVIRDQAAWESLWANATRNFTPPPPVPSVDFAREMVVVAAMGGRPTGGYSISVESAHEAGASVYVTVREVSPGSNCIVTQAGTSPVAAARVPRRDGTVLFVERSEVRDC